MSLRDKLRGTATWSPRLFSLPPKPLSVVVVVTVLVTFWAPPIHTKLIHGGANAREHFWCPNKNCYHALDAELWDLNMWDHTNECTTDQECVQRIAQQHGCGLPTDVIIYRPGSQIKCVDTAGNGTKHCSITCLVTQGAPCLDHQNPPIPPDQLAAGPQQASCAFLTNTDDNSVSPNCPCVQSPICDVLPACPDNPIPNPPANSAGAEIIEILENLQGIVSG